MELRKKNGWKALVMAAVCAFGLAFSSPARAQTGVGVVDEDKLADGYVAYKKALDAIDQRAKGVDRQLEARELLSVDEGKRFDDLILKSGRAAADEGALQTLVTTGSGRRAEYLALIAKSSRNADEDAKIKKYLEYSRGNDAPLKALSDKLFGQIRDEQEAAEKKFTDQANSIIAEVAKRRKLSMVARKRALVWSDDSVDITNEVIAQLNK
jgi:Skp family chaperone for outer membrane proteins